MCVDSWTLANPYLKLTLSIQPFLLHRICPMGHSLTLALACMPLTMINMPQAPTCQNNIQVNSIELFLYQRTCQNSQRRKSCQAFSVQVWQIHSSVAFFWVPFFLVSFYLLFYVWVVLQSMCSSLCSQAFFDSWNVSSLIFLKTAPILFCLYHSN